ncbi:Heat shock cognate 71 kDa protein, partial [Galemys pyrenaicus]
TTYLCVGIFQHGKVETMVNDQGNQTTPSNITFVDTKRLIVFYAKYLMEHQFDSAVVQFDMEHSRIMQTDPRSRYNIRERQMFLTTTVSTDFNDSKCQAANDAGTIFKVKHKKAISENKRAIHHACTACECDKKGLYFTTQTGTEVNSLYEGINFYISITCAQFEKSNTDLFDGTLDQL